MGSRETRRGEERRGEQKEVNEMSVEEKSEERSTNVEKSTKNVYKGEQREME